MKGLRWLFLAILLGAVGVAVVVVMLPKEELKPQVEMPVAEGVEGVDDVEDVDAGGDIGGVPVPRQDLIEDAEEATLPDSILLAVPFTSQAPFANWDEVHEETCEEASLLMVDAYYKGLKSLEAGAVEATLQDMVQKELQQFGYFKDTTAAETAAFAKSYYGYGRVELLQNPTVEEMKAHLAAKRPVIIPAAGRVIANPYFSGAGPDYHMLVLIGYNDGGFITNDPGTKRGGKWWYSYDHIMKAIHDFPVEAGIETHPEDIPASKKVVIVIYGN